MRHRVWFVLTFVLLGASAFLGSLCYKNHRMLVRSRADFTSLQRRMNGILAQVRQETYNIGRFTNPSTRPGEPVNLMPPMPEEMKAQLRSFRQQQLFEPDYIPVAEPYAVSQRFKPTHPALDFAAAQESRVLATATGLVDAVYVDPYFGNVIIIDHLNGLASFYAHLDETFFRVGDLVKKGEPIGLVGNTGHSSAAHLHFEIREGGKSVDPERYLNFGTKL
jgi:murein DD-endopeptidase MepM/ murein hydrolase activator NlpD